MNRKIDNIDFALVQKLASENKSIEYIALELDINPSTFHRWLKQNINKSYPKDKQDFYELLQSAYKNGKYEYIKIQREKIKKV